MRLASHVDNNLTIQTRLNIGEADQFRALEKAVRAEEARKKEEETERRVSLGLPAEEEKEGWFKRVLGMFGGKDGGRSGRTGGGKEEVVGRGDWGGEGSGIVGGGSAGGRGRDGVVR